MRQGSTEAGRGRRNYLQFVLLDGPVERTRRRTGNYRTTDHTTLHSVISGDCL